MADFPIIQTARLTPAPGGTTYDTTVTASTTIHTKGAYNQIIAATPFEAHGLWIVLQEATSTVALYLIDIAIGAEGSEIDLLSNLHFTTGGATGWPVALFLPLLVPSGVRLSARMQASTTAGPTQRITLLMAAGGFARMSPFVRATTIGANTGTSGGTQIDPGATQDTKGAWVELSASLPHPVRWIVPIFGGKGNNAPQNTGFSIDIGVGAAASEGVILANLPLTSRTSGSDPWSPWGYSLPCNLSQGLRLAVRAQSGTNEATDRLFDMIAVLLG